MMTVMTKYGLMRRLRNINKKVFLVTTYYDWDEHITIQKIIRSIGGYEYYSIYDKIEDPETGKMFNLVHREVLVTKKDMKKISDTLESLGVGIIYDEIDSDNYNRW